jgi:hypothetical protein
VCRVGACRVVIRRVASNRFPRLGSRTDDSDDWVVLNHIIKSDI